MKWFETRMVVGSVLGLCLLLAVAVPTARADFVFGEPVELGPGINQPVTDNLGQAFPCISPDGLELYFCRSVPGRLYDIFVARRPTVDSEWGEPVTLGPTVNSSTHDWSLSISADGLSLYYTYGGSSGYPWRLYVTKRATIHDDWGPPASIGGAMANEAAWGPCISPDDLELYFCSQRAGGRGDNDLWVTKRATVNDPWGPPVNLGPAINSTSGDIDPVISPDGLVLFFRSIAGTFVTRRATKSDPWGPRIGPFAGSAKYRTGGISSDGSLLYVFCDGRRTLWQIPILPWVDFNGDGKVDITDLLELIENWGTNNTLYDIGPYPWGDGVVDAADLEVLMRYWGQDLLGPSELIALWKLDETEGVIAYDSVGTHDARVLGAPVWRPEGGRIGGALELDGVADALETDFILDPKETSFSVFMWVKGGAPGQVILSQANGAYWLQIDPSTGNLMTSLNVPSVAGGRPLHSQTAITDGEWHRVGLTWGLSMRTLYVDNAVVARDLGTDLTHAQTQGGLYIGAPVRLNFPGYWRGLIDDVQLYTGVVKP